MIERSQHPADRLIRELIQTGRSATADEIDRIVERMATAPFSSEQVRVPLDLRGAEVEGERLGERADSLRYHLAQRTLADEQWALGTTARAYVGDLREAVRSPAAHVLVYDRRGGSMAAALVANAIPPSHLGAKPLPWVYVAYSTDRGTIVSGYQASSVDEISIPEDARWLK